MQRSVVLRTIKNHKIESSIVFIIFLIGLFSFSYGDGKSLTAYSVQFWDSLFSGNLLHFQEVFAENIRNAPHADFDFHGGRLFASIPWAIWNFPLWLTHNSVTNPDVLTFPCLIWSKGFLLVCLVLAGVQCYQIVFYMTENEKYASFALLFLVGSGVCATSVGYAMQDEIFYILAFLIALKCYIVRRNIIGTLLWLALSITFAPFMILIAFVILIAQYKNVFKLLGWSIALLVPYMALVTIFPAREKTSYMAETVEQLFFTTTAQGAYERISVFLLALILVYGIAYFKKSNDDINETLIRQLALVSIFMCTFCWLHFYRWMICTPFLILCIFACYNKEAKVKTLVIIFSIYETIRFVYQIGYNLDASLSSDLIKNILGESNPLHVFELLDLYFESGMDHALFFSISLIIACANLLIVFIEMKHTEFASFAISIRKICIIYLAAVVVGFVGFFWISYKTLYLDLGIDGTGELAPAVTGSIALEENYYSSGETITQLQVLPLTWDEDYPDNLLLQVDVIDSTTDTVIASKNVPVSSLPDHVSYTIDLPNVKLVKDRWYTFRLSASEKIEDGEPYIYFIRSEYNTSFDDKYYASIYNLQTGERENTNYNIMRRIIGWK